MKSDGGPLTQEKRVRHLKFIIVGSEANFCRIVLRSGFSTKFGCGLLVSLINGIECRVQCHGTTYSQSVAGTAKKCLGDWCTQHAYRREL